MAKKKLESDLPDFDTDLDLDFDTEAEGGFDQTGPKKDRSPVTNVLRGATSEVKKTLTSPSFIQKTLRSVLPKTYGEISDGVGEVASTTSELYDHASQELKPQLSRIARRIDQFIPEERKGLKKLSDSVLNKLGAKEYTTSATDPTEQTVASTLAGIFQEEKSQAEVNQKISQKRKLLDDQIGQQRHRESQRSLVQIAQNTSIVAQYTQNVTQRYQKKMLEIQLRSYLGQTEHFSMVKQMYETFKAQNESIVKNTALPEYVKITNSERFAELAKTRMINSLWGEGSALQQGLSRLKQAGKELISGARLGLERLDMGLEQGLSAKEQMDQMNQMLIDAGAEPLSKAEMMGGMAAGEGIDWVMKKVTPEVRRRLAEKQGLKDKLARGARAVLNPGAEIQRIRESQEWNEKVSDYDSFKGKGYRFLDFVMEQFEDRRAVREFGKSEGMDELRNPTMGFDQRAHLSLTEIIPHHLAAIRQELTIARTGDENAPLVTYDFGRREFVTRDTMKRRINDQLTSEARNNFGVHGIKKTAENINQGRLQGEDEIALQVFVSRMSKVNNLETTPKKIKELEAYKQLPKSVKSVVDHYLDALDNNVDKETLRTDLTRDLQKIRSDTATMGESLNRYTDAGYGDLLEELGLVERTSNGNFRVIESAYDNFLDRKGLVESDINVKEAIREVKPEELVKNIKDRLKASKLNKKVQKLRSSTFPTSPREAWEGLKKTRLFDWKYKEGHGDESYHSGPMAQDVRRNLGEDAAPDGKTLDPQTINGKLMAAVKHLGEKVESYFNTTGEKVTSKIASARAPSLEKNTAEIVRILRRMEKNPSRRRQRGGGVQTAQNHEDDSYAGLSKSIIGQIIDLGAKVSGDVFGAATNVFKFGKNKVAKPIINFVSDTYKKNKDGIGDTIGGLFKKAGDMAGSVLDFGKDILTNKLPAGFKTIGNIFTWGKEKAMEELNKARDLYLPDGTRPVILAVKLRAGFYRDSVTGEVLSSIDDIMKAKGDVVDSAGNILLALEDKAKGLYDIHGEKVRSTGKQLIQGLVGAGFWAGEKFVESFKRLKSLSMKSFEGLTGKFKDKFNGMKFPDGIGLFNREGTDYLRDIRDILLDGPAAFRKKLKQKGLARRKEAVAAAAAATAPPSEKPAEETKPSFLDEWKQKFNASPLGQPVSGGISLQGIKDGFKSFKDRMLAPKEQQQKWRQAQTPARQYNAMGRLGTGSMPTVMGPSRPDFVGPMPQKGFGGLFKKLGKGVGGFASAMGGLASSFLPTVSPQMEDQPGNSELPPIIIQAGSQKVIQPKGERAWNDTDGDGERDGSIETRRKRLEELKASRNKGAAAVDTGPRYKGANIFDTLFNKAGKIMDLIQGGMSGLFSGMGSLLGKLPGVGTILGGIGSKLGGAGRAIMSAGGSAINAIKTKGAMGAIKAGGKGLIRTALTTLPRLYAGTVLKAGAVAATSALNIGGAAVVSVATALATPLLIGAAVIGAGYGIWRIYKWAVRNDANEYEKLRFLQYGLPLNNEAKSLYHHVFGIEEYLQDGRIVYVRGTPSLNFKKIKPEEILELAGIEKDNKEAGEAFAKWFKERFSPIFLQHLKVLLQIDNKAKLREVAKMKPEQRMQYLEGTKMDTGPYDIDSLPFATLPVIITNKDAILGKINDLLLKVKEEIKEKLKGKDQVLLPIKKSEEHTKPAEKNLPKPPPPPPVSEKKPNTQVDLKASSSASLGLEETGDGYVEPADASDQGAIQPKSLLLAKGPLAKGESGLQFLKLDKDADVDNLSPATKKLFFGMAEEYYNLTGKTIFVDEGYRTRARQEELRRIHGKGAAAPGNSTHEFGLGIDIPSKVANELEALGLMRKYGFTRPVGQEPWHLEPAGIQRDLDLAKRDPNAADSMTFASIYKGGGGYGTLGKSVRKYGRDKAYALALMNASEKALTPKPKESDVAGTALAKVPELPEDAPKTQTAQQALTPSVNNTPEQMSLSFNSSNVQSAVERQIAHDQSQKGGDEPNKEGEAPVTTKNVTSSNEDIMKTIDAAARKAGVDPTIMKALAIVESDLNPNARNPRSSAGGLYQAVNATWDEQLGKHGKKYGLSSSASRYDPETATLIMAEYLKENARGIKDIAPNPSITDYYFTHFLGPGGAKRMLSAPPDAPAISYASDKAIRANRELFLKNGRPVTVREFYNGFTDKFRKKTKSYGLQIGGGQGLTLETNTVEMGGGAQGSGIVPPSLPQSAPAAEPAKVEREMIQSSTGGLFVDKRGNTPLAREKREAGQTFTGPDFTGVESTLGQSLKVQTESLEILKNILNEVKGEKLAEVLAAALQSVQAQAKGNELREADQRNMGRSTQVQPSTLDLRRRAS